MDELSLEVLISCMNRNDFSIVEKTNISSNVLIVSQTNEEKYLEHVDQHQSLIRLKCSKDRGLSKSRNLAIKMAVADLCLLCDDDEVLFDNYSETIKNAFHKYNDADVICFAFRGLNKKYPRTTRKVNFFSALKISSIQIAFRRKTILEKNIRFDERIGSGVMKAGGEEGKFLHDCLRKNLKVLYCRDYIGELKPSESRWFDGFTTEYFYDRGRSTKIVLGANMSILYGLYFLFFKYNIYKKETSFTKATIWLFKGIFSR